MFNLNAKGPFFAVQKLAPLINQGGSIVLTTSTANIKGMPMIAAYGGAKAALRSFARTFAAELLPRTFAKAGLGTGIVEALTRQLQGTISVVDNKPGTAVRIAYDEAAARDSNLPAAA